MTTTTTMPRKQMAEWNGVLCCIVHSSPPVKRSGEPLFPLWLTDLERNARRKEVANKKKKGAKKIKHRRSQTRHYLHANRQKFGERMGQWGGGVGMGL